MTELHTFDAHGQVLAVVLCRHIMVLRPQPRPLNDDAPMFWICTNETCGTAQAARADELAHE